LAVVETCQKAGVAAVTGWAAAFTQQLKTTKANSTGDKKVIIISNNAAADAVLAWVFKQNSNLSGKHYKRRIQWAGESNEKGSINGGVRY